MFVRPFYVDSLVFMGDGADTGNDLSDVFAEDVIDTVPLIGSITPAFGGYQIGDLLRLPLDWNTDNLQ